ncbi:MAG: NAD(P)/FAD-dependent oxidoreductase [Natronomonas sp.]
MHVVVAGGGLAGLVAARRLAAEEVDVELFESAGTVGGRVGSRTVDGFTLDRGFQVLFTAYPAVRTELNLDDLDLRRFDSGATIARPNHRSTIGDPSRDLGTLLPTLFNRDIRFGDLRRLYRLRQNLADGDPADLLTDDRYDGKTIERYLTDRGFSDQFLENFAAPFFGGITLDRSLETSSRLFEYTFRMLLDGDAGVPAAGMGAIPGQLRDRAEAAGATIRTNRTVTDVDVDDRRVTVKIARNTAGTEDVVQRSGNEHVFPDAVVIATDPRTACDLAGVRTPTDVVGCVTVHVSLPDHQVLDTGGRLILNAVDGRPNTIAPMSAVAPEYAPDERQLYSATFLGEVSESDETLFERVRETLSAWYPERDFGDVALCGVDRMEFAQFRQPPGFRHRLPDVSAPSGPVYLAGDYTQWSSIQGALESGRVAATAVLDNHEVE